MTSDTWQTVPLGTIADFRNGINYDKNSLGKGIKVIGVADFQDYTSISFKNLTEINPDGVVGEEDMLKDGDILFVRSNGSKELVGRSLYIDGLNEQVTFSGFTIRLRFNSKEVYPLFCAYFFKSHLIRRVFLELGGGTNISNLSQQILKSLLIPLPPLSEQYKIAKILSIWDRAIDLISQLIVAKQQHKRGVMQQLLTGKKRFPDSKGWSSRKIGELFRSITRFDLWDDEKTYIQAIVKRWSQGIELRPPLLGKQIKTKNLQAIRTGDFLISDIQASYGAMSIVGSQHDGLYVSNVYTILVPRDEHQIYTPYFDQLSRTSLMRHFVVQSSNGFKAERIRLGFVLDTFLQQKVYLPDDIAEQRRITDLLQLCDDEITLLSRKLMLLKKQKQGLMQQLLTGKIRVKT